METEITLVLCYAGQPHNPDVVVVTVVVLSNQRSRQVVGSVLPPGRVAGLD
jgi:hypothetical protein